MTTLSMNVKIQNFEKTFTNVPEHVNALKDVIKQSNSMNGNIYGLKEKIERVTYENIVLKDKCKKFADCCYEKLADN